MWLSHVIHSFTTQVHFGLIDLELHSSYTPHTGGSIFEHEAKVAQRTQVGL